MSKRAGTPSLSKLLSKRKLPEIPEDADDRQELKGLQKAMLRAQQGIWHRKKRAILVFEGFDASGKGGAIRRLTEGLDPRGFIAHPIGPPLAAEQGRHWLYRFWARLPEPGVIAIFDRSWYGRVLVERVEGLAEPKAWKRAYDEIHEFERMLVEDGVDLVKIFIGITRAEQLSRFKARLEDPYKQWKLTEADIEARARWDDYVEAVDAMFRRTHSKRMPWRLVAGDDKRYARLEVLRAVTESLGRHGKWIEGRASEARRTSLERALKELGKCEGDLG